MSPKCIKISICICFLIFSLGLLVLAACFLDAWSLVLYFPRGGDSSLRNPTLIFQTVHYDEYSAREKQVNLRDMSSDSEKGTLNTPSLEAYLQALPGEEGQELRLSGLALYSKLANACQPLVDISKSKFQGNKIALVSLEEFSLPVCTLLGLAINAQNAGYSVLIFDVRSAPWFSDDNEIQTDTKDKILIPVLSAVPSFDSPPLFIADRRRVDISVPTGSDLANMRVYLSHLFFWFLLGPVITLEWLRRKKRLRFMSGALQRDHEESAIFGDERSVRSVDEGSLRSEAQESVANYDQETEHYQTGGDEQPLIAVVNDPRFNLATRMRQRTSIRVVVFFRKIFGKFAVGSGYVILILVALPVGISSGGWSFFRFDENEQSFTKSFWDDLLSFNISNREAFDLITGGINCIGVTILDFFLPLWWSSLRIFCFFLYSRFACKTTWTVPSNSSKLIRSDWFASNMYLLILSVVVPYCSFTMDSILNFILFAYFATYNMVCTIYNLLFIIILNKHKFVTRYVFYIGVCMICAYIESDIVAVYYFMMNSEGSLTNLKLTALRTVAIGLTLTLSLSSSMHIIRKLTKPQESLFEGLSEK